MTQLIIYPNSLGKIVIVSPAPDADITEVAAAVVPADTPHRIIDADDLPPASDWLWSETGPILAAPPPPPALPEEVSRFQARAALIVYGSQIGRPNLLVEADAIVAGLQPGQFGLTMLQIEVAREAWSAAQVIRRDSPTLNLLFPALGLSLPEERDAIFVIAAGIVA
jgi:hypothetical protein